MKLRCPACGADINFDQAEKEAGLESLAKAAAAFGADWELVSEYLDSFRARPGAGLALKKRLRLAREVWAMWAGKFQFGGQSYQVSREALREGLQQVCNRGLQGLKNHNYLKQILVGRAGQEASQAERELKAREDRQRAGGVRPKHSALSTQPSGLITPENVARFADPGCPHCGGAGMVKRNMPALGGLEVTVRCECTENEKEEG